MLVVVGDGHHRFCNFDLGSSDIDRECRKVVVFSFERFLLCLKVGEGRVMVES